MKFKHYPEIINSNKELKAYHARLKKGAKEFKITPEDLSNLTDLELMMPSWFVQEVLKPNNLLPWYLKFFGKVERITLGDMNGKV